MTDVKFWQVRAESLTGAVMTFGLRAADGQGAEQAAMRLLPFDLGLLTVTREAPAQERQGQ